MTRTKKRLAVVAGALFLVLITKIGDSIYSSWRPQTDDTAPRWLKVAIPG